MSTFCVIHLYVTFRFTCAQHLDIPRSSSVTVKASLVCARLNLTYQKGKKTQHIWNHSCDIKNKYEHAQ